MPVNLTPLKSASEGPPSLAKRFKSLELLPLLRLGDCGDIGGQYFLVL